MLSAVDLLLYFDLVVCFAVVLLVARLFVDYPCTTVHLNKLCSCQAQAPAKC